MSSDRSTNMQFELAHRLCVPPGSPGRGVLQIAAGPRDPLRKRHRFYAHVKNDDSNKTLHLA
eukprot:16446772-Heterocapsa_arctica.AAC.1